MKVSHVLGREQLDEVNLRQALATGIAGAALMGVPHKATAPNAPPQTRVATPQPKLEPIQVTAKRLLDDKTQKLINVISQRYDANPEFVEQVIELVKKYEKPGFPTARDLLAIIAVESEFDPEAVSGLRKDPAVGLMQIRPRVWGVDPDQLKDPETNIQMGSNILHKYYRHLHHDKEAAIQAYNVGLTDYQQGVENPNYLMKVATRLRNLAH